MNNYLMYRQAHTKETYLSPLCIYMLYFSGQQETGKEVTKLKHSIVLTKKSYLKKSHV